MKKIFAAALAALTALGGAQAQFKDGDLGLHIGGGIGVFALTDDTATTPAGDELTNDIGPRVALSLYAGKALHKYLLVEGQLGFWSAQWDGFEEVPVSFSCPAADPDECVDPMISTTSVTINAVLTAPMNSKVRPYAGVGAGFMSTSLNLDNVDNKIGFGYLMKGGVDFAVSDGLRIGAEGTYLAPPKADFDNFAEMDVAGFAFMATLTAAI